jgi:hypothetical protein
MAGGYQEIDDMLAVMAEEMKKRGKPKPRTAQYVGLLDPQKKEVSGPGYERQVLTQNGEIVFPASSGSWGKVASVGVFDASGVLLAVIDLGAGVFLGPGDCLTVQLDLGHIHVYPDSGRRCVDCGAVNPNAPKTRKDFPDLSRKLGRRGNYPQKF